MANKHELEKIINVNYPDDKKNKSVRDAIKGILYLYDKERFGDDFMFEEDVHRFIFLCDTLAIQEYNSRIALTEYEPMLDGPISLRIERQLKKLKEEDNNLVVKEGTRNGVTKEKYSYTSDPNIDEQVEKILDHGLNKLQKFVVQGNDKVVELSIENPFYDKLIEENFSS